MLVANLNWKGGLFRVAVLAAAVWTAYSFYSDPPTAAVMAIVENHPSSEEAYAGGIAATKEKDTCVAAAMKHAPPNPASPLIPPEPTQQALQCYRNWEISGALYPRPYRDEAWTEIGNFALKWVGGLAAGLFGAALILWIALGFASVRRDTQS